MTTTKTAPNTNGTTTQAMNDTFKAGCDANQKVMNAFSTNFAKGFPFNFGQPVPAMDMPAMFEKMTKAMNSMVDSTARMTTECSTLAIDAMRNNARVVERTGEMMVAQMTGKTTKPAADACREICDEAMGFSTKAQERMVKMTTEHAQRVSQIVEETMTCKTCNA